MTARTISTWMASAAIARVAETYGIKGGIALHWQRTKLDGLATRRGWSWSSRTSREEAPRRHNKKKLCQGENPNVGGNDVSGTDRAGGEGSAQAAVVTSRSAPASALVLDEELAA